MNLKSPPYSVTHFFENQIEMEINYDGKQFVRKVDYNSDNLKVWGKNVNFLYDPKFLVAYKKGMNSGHRIGKSAGIKDLHIEWRSFVCCWAAWHGKLLEGDFVECGVNTGIYSLAICEYIDFNSTNKKFWLYDTFDGIPEDQMMESEKIGIEEYKTFYYDCFDRAKQNFLPYPNVKLIKGKVPETLNSVDIGDVCYLSIDMNICYPEIEAMKFFWNKLVSGACVVFDDYAWKNHVKQMEELDKFASSKGTKILPLPTGQGLLIKP